MSMYAPIPPATGRCQGCGRWFKGQRGLAAHQSADMAALECLSARLTMLDTIKRQRTEAGAA